MPTSCCCYWLSKGTGFCLSWPKINKTAHSFEGFSKPSSIVQRHFPQRITIPTSLAKRPPFRQSISIYNKKKYKPTFFQTKSKIFLKRHFLLYVVPMEQFRFAKAPACYNTHMGPNQVYLSIQYTGQYHLQS